MRSRWGFVVATAVVFSALTLAWVAPILPRFATADLTPRAYPTPLGRADAMLTSYMLAWSSHALRTNPLGLFDANVFHPLRWTFAFSENLVASGLLVTPIDLVWRNPVVDHNALVIASFVLAGTGTALLVRELGGGIPAAWLAGALVAFNPFRFATIGHVHALSTHWMPFALLALHRCLRRGRGAVAVAVTIALVALSSVYYAYFFFIAVAVLMAADWALGCPAAPGGRRRALAGIAAAGTVTAAMLVPYLIARDIYGLVQDTGQAFWFEARAITYVGAVVEPLAYARQRYVAHQNPPTVIGIAMLPLLVLGLAASAPAWRGGRRTATAHLVMAVALALVSLGPVMQWRPSLEGGPPGPWALLAAIVPGFAALRVPARACTVVVLVAAVFAAFGAEILWRRARDQRRQTGVALLLVTVALLEGWRPPFEVVSVPWSKTGIPPVYDWLARQPGREAMLELPIGMPAEDAASMLMSTRHWRPLVNGYSGFAPMAPFLRRFLLELPDDRTVRLLHDVGVRWIVVHPADMPPSGLCRTVPEKLAPHVAIAYRDDGACVLEILGAPAPPSRPADRPVSLAAATITGSDGSSAAAAIDGRLDSHWVRAVDAGEEAWLQLDLPEPHAISRLVVALGPHFGEYLRQWRIEASDDGATWRSVATDDNAMPPLVGVRADPSRLETELRLDEPVTTRHLRLVRPAAIPRTPADLFPNWRRWGVHELEVHATAP